MPINTRIGCVDTVPVKNTSLIKKPETPDKKSATKKDMNLCRFIMRQLKSVTKHATPAHNEPVKPTIYADAQHNDMQDMMRKTSDILY